MKIMKYWCKFLCIGGIRFRDMSGSAKGERSRVSGLYTHGGGFAGFIKTG